MRDTGTLLDGRRRDLANDVGDPAHRGDDLVHRRPGFLHQAASRLDPLHTVGDQILDLTGGFGTSLSEASDLGGHHRKTAPLFAGTRRFHRRIERQNIGLKGDAINYADDVGNLARAVADLAHGRDHLLNDLTAAARHFGGTEGELVGLARICCIGIDRTGHLLDAARSLLQAGSLLLGALRQITVADRDLGGGHRDLFGRHLDRAHRALEMLGHPRKRRDQLTDFIGRGRRQHHPQITGGDRLGRLARRLERHDQSTVETECEREQESERDQGRTPHNRQRHARRGGVGTRRQFGVTTVTGGGADGGPCSSGLLAQARDLVVGAMREHRDQHTQCQHQGARDRRQDQQLESQFHIHLE